MGNPLSKQFVFPGELEAASEEERRRELGKLPPPGASPCGIGYTYGVGQYGPKGAGGCRDAAPRQDCWPDYSSTGWAGRYGYPSSGAGYPSSGSAYGSGYGSGWGAGYGTGLGAGLSSDCGPSFGSRYGSGLGSGFGPSLGSGLASEYGAGYGARYGPSLGSGLASEYGAGYGARYGPSLGSGLASEYGAGYGARYSPGLGLGLASEYGPNYGSRYGPGFDQGFGACAGSGLGSGLGSAWDSSLPSGWPAPARRGSWDGPPRFGGAASFGDGYPAGFPSARFPSTWDEAAWKPSQSGLSNSPYSAPWKSFPSSTPCPPSWPTPAGPALSGANWNAPTYTAPQNWGGAAAAAAARFNAPTYANPSTNFGALTGGSAGFTPPPYTPRSFPSTYDYTGWAKGGAPARAPEGGAYSGFGGSFGGVTAPLPAYNEALASTFAGCPGYGKY